ncbi:MAG: hypothetical protein MPJ50_17080, partial [Pirellulales bacterium]|nr:hypothetical protein [Pirellulales bacterium]
TRLRHPPGGWKNLTNVNFARTPESRAGEERRGNSIAAREAMGTVDEWWRRNVKVDNALFHSPPASSSAGAKDIE